jgi:CheY-like chemotaxis protein
MLTQPPLHILLVDPDPGAAQVTAALVLRAAPEARLTREPDALRALQQLPQLRPDVLIVDPSPAPLAGLELIRLARTLQPAAQIIVLPSQPTLRLRRQMDEFGVAHYLEKPAPLPLDELRALFTRPRSAEQLAQRVYCESVVPGPEQGAS